MFVLIVNVKMPAELLPEYRAQWGALAEHVRVNEPGALEYTLWESDKEPGYVMILEKYTDKEHAFLEVHRSSAPFAAFKQWMASKPEGTFVTTGHSYTEGPQQLAA